MATESQLVSDEHLATSIDLLRTLQQRAENLLSEFRTFQAHLKSSNLSKSVETRIFRRGVESEAKSLGTLAAKLNIIASAQKDAHDDEVVESRRLHTLRSSNLPFYEAVWTSAKRSQGIKALGRRLYWDDLQKSAIQAIHPDFQGMAVPRSKRKQLRSALIDVVADDGLEWIKVSIVSAKRLLFEMAKEGWEGYDEDSDNSGLSHDEAKSKIDTFEMKLDIVRLAEDLRDAALATRIRYKHPKVKFVLPKLTEGDEEAIDTVLANIRATGALVECGPTTTLNGLTNLSLSPDSRPVFDRMLPSSGQPILTPTINIDCTILLALISDISHIPRPDLPPAPANYSGTYHTAILKQIASEEDTPLLSHEIYPILSGRSLVCTSLAAQRMREIVTTMGTPSEEARAGILLGEGAYTGVCAAELRSAWDEISTHNTPDDIALPLKVQEYISPFTTATAATATADDGDDAATHFPAAIAKRLAASLNLSAINASVFMYGWQRDVVTLTSNRVVAGQIEKGLNWILDEEERALAKNVAGVNGVGGVADTDVHVDGSAGAGAGAGGVGRRAGGKGKETGDDGQEFGLVEFIGPKIYVCETARSLVGKEKGHGIRP